MKKNNCPNVAKNVLILSIVSLIFAIYFSSSAYALTSDNINFQGKIVRNDTGYEGLNVVPGSPACVIDGAGNDTCDFQVAYYTASTGGTLLLTETFTNVEIGQYDGVFELSLGSGSMTTTGQCRDGTCNTPSEVISEYKDLYLELKFSPDGTNLTETFTRMPLEATAYSIFSKYAEGANDAFKLSTSVSSQSQASPTTGMIYYNTTTSQLTVYDGDSWEGVKSSLWTDVGTFTYLTSTTNDLVLGASTVSDSTFFFDMDGSSGSYLEIDDASNTNRLLTILSGGNVGIGTATPSAKLEVAGSSSTITNASGDLTISTGGLNGNILLSPNGTGSVRVNSPLAIRETGTTPTYYTTFQGGDQSGAVTYTLPTSSTNGLLRNTAGVWSWDNTAYISQAYSTIQEEGTALTQRSILNFVGSGFTAADNTTRTNVTLDGGLNSLASLATTGIVVASATDTYIARTLTGTSNRITVTNGTGVSGNPIIDLASTYVGQTSITTLGTIATGTWNATAISATKGGTGLTAYTTGDILYASATNTLSARAIGTAGQVLTVTGGVPTWETPAAGHDALTLAAIGSTPNANAATLTNQVLNLEPASASFGGVVTTGTQTFAGDKTFVGATSTTTNIVSITGNSLTAGKVLGISSSATGFTGSLADITLSGSNALNTGTLLSLNNTGTLNTNTTFLINHYATGTGNLAFRVNDVSGDTTPFVIDGAGNVGIGTATPTNKFVVNTSAYSTIELQYSGTSVVDIFSNNSSNIFIGLDSGSVISTGTGNIAFGDNALSANTTGMGNTAIGHFALDSNVAKQGSTALGYQAMMYADSTASEVPSFNTAIGYQALTGSGVAANNTGTSNTAVGYQSLTANTSGSQNTALGVNTLNANTTGTQNVAIGQNALFTNVAKQGSVAIGYEAMRYADSTATAGLSYNTAIGFSALKGSNISADNTGINNTAVGGNTLLSNTSGNYNIAVGTSTMFSNTTGNYNVAIGGEALRNNVAKQGSTALGYQAMMYADSTATAGLSYNTALGYQALKSGSIPPLNTGTGNTALGYQAGYVMTSGSNNTLIGYLAGNGITSGGNNIMIGYDTDGTATVSDQLNIGNSIYGNLSNDYISIGDSTPTEAMFTVGSTSQYRVNSNGDLIRIKDVPYVWPSSNTTGILANNGSGTLSWSTIASLGGVTGTGSAGQITYWNGTSTVTGENDFWWDATNNRLGIGTNTPQASLSVNGLVYQTGLGGSTYFGEHAGRVDDLSINNNTGIGYRSLYSNTSGDSNTAVGYRSLYSNTTGNYNTGIGYGSLYSNTTGYYNTALGNSSLYSNTTGYDNTALGYYSLYANTTGTQNTALGYQAGMYQADGITTLTDPENSIYMGYNAKGKDNDDNNSIVIGYNAVGLGANTVVLGNDSIVITALNGLVYQRNLGGSTYFGENAGRVDDLSSNNNTGIGHNSLYSNTTGYYNTALGNSSLYSNTTGYDNTAVGVASLLSNTTGVNNMALGNSSLRSNTTGNYNIALGNFSLYKNTTGHDNLALGYGSLNLNTTGSYNIAVGNYALISNTTSNENTALGNGSLNSNTTGSSNTAVGGTSLYSNTTGAFNTALGYYAGRYQADGSTALTDPEYSIYIGNNARGKDNNDNNSIVIGYNAVGLGANTVVLGNDSIVTTALKGYVGIGVTGPTYRLQLPNTANNAGKGQANAWVTYSDKTLKENIQNITGGLDKIMALRGVTFDWKGQGVASSGFIAQEVDLVIPDLVSTDINGIKALDYGRFTPYLVEAIKEQQLQIQTAYNRIEQLENINENKIISITTPGWYRISKLDINDDHSNIKINNTSIGSSQNIVLSIDSTLNNQNINIVSNLTTGEYGITKARINNESGIKYLEIYIPEVNENKINVKITESSNWIATDIVQITEEVNNAQEYALSGILFGISDMLKVEETGLKVGGDLIANTTTGNIGDITNRWNDIYAKGAIRLGSGSGQEGAIRFNAESKRLELSNDGSTWVQLGDLTSQMVISPEYPGSILFADGSDNLGKMTSDAVESNGTFKNYYEWISNKEVAQDYDILVRITLPNDFVSWKDDAIYLDYMTENSVSVENNSVDVTLIGSSGVDAQSLDHISTLPGAWERMSLKSLDINDCNKAGDSCTLRISLTSSMEYFVRVGDITLNYNRSL